MHLKEQGQSSKGPLEYGNLVSGQWTKAVAYSVTNRKRSDEVQTHY